MINGGYPETPDAWIERTDEDRYGCERDPYEDAHDCPKCGLHFPDCICED